MKKILLLIAVMLFITTSVIAQNKATITSTQAGDWDQPATWVGNSVPSSTDDVVIAHSLDVDDTRSCNSITINAAARLDVEASLTVATTSNIAGAGGLLKIKSGGTYTQTAGNFTNTLGTIQILAGRAMVFSDAGSTLANTGTITISSNSSAYGAIMLPGTYTESGAGVVNYSRFLAGTATWELIGPMLSGYSIEDFVEDNDDIATGNGSGDGASGEYAVGVYTNTSEAYTAGNTWQNYTTSTVAAAGNLEPGKGYQMATDNSSSGGGAEINFTGNIETGNVTESITNNEEGSSNANGADGTKFALLSNPYPSYITVASFISGNSAALHDAHEAVYGWDGSQYDTYNSGTGGNIAPGAGFMVGAVGPDANSSTVTFTVSMQVNGGGEDFISGDAMDPDDRAELFIGISQNDISRRTKLFFLDNTTDGLDLAYDAGTLDIANNMIFSRLVEGDQGVDMSIQSLAYSEMWDKVIPIGINAMAGEEITVSVTHKTTPADLKIYLEDAQEGTFTLINNEDFVLTPTSDLEGVGRFYIHMTADTLSNEEVNTSLLNAYKEVDSNYITIEGLATHSTSTEVSLFNILGTKVMDTTLDNTSNTQMISTNGLSTGIYVIKLESGQNQLTKKLIIR